MEPQYKNRPVAVCGSVEERHGIVLAKNQLAKEKGVITAEAIWQARQKCPELLIIPPHYEAYLHYSKQVRAIYERYTDYVESFGMDECWLDVTHSKLFGNPAQIALEMKERVKQEIGLTISVGVSFNKVFAKLGSDLKKPDAVTEIPYAQFKKIVWPLRTSELLGIGRATRKKMEVYGIRTIGDLAQSEPDFLKKLLGIHGLRLWEYANGLDLSRVRHSSCHIEAKSIGHGLTTIRDLTTQDEVDALILYLIQDISHKLIQSNLLARSLQISIRDPQMLFREFQAPLPYATRSSLTIYRHAKRLFSKKWKQAISIRALTVRVTKLVADNSPMQLEFGEDMLQRIRAEKLELALDKIRTAHGMGAVSYAGVLRNRYLPSGHSAELILPSAMYR